MFARGARRIARDATPTPVDAIDPGPRVRSRSARSPGPRSAISASAGSGHGSTVRGRPIARRTRRADADGSGDRLRAGERSLLEPAGILGDEEAEAMRGGIDGSSGHRKTVSDGRDRYDILVPKRRADDRIRHRGLRVRVRDRAPVRPTRTDFVPTGVDGDRLRSVRNDGTTAPGGILFPRCGV